MKNRTHAYVVCMSCGGGGELGPLRRLFPTAPHGSNLAKVYTHAEHQHATFAMLVQMQRGADNADSV